MSAGGAPSILPWGRSLLTAACVAAVIGLALGVFPYLVVAVLLASAALAQRALPPPAVSVERELSATQVRSGETFEVRTSVTWGDDATGTITLHEPLPDALGLKEGRNLAAFALDGATGADFAFAAEAPRRGVHRLGPVAAVVPDPLAAGAAHVLRVATEVELVVHASAPPTPRLRAPSAWGVTTVPGGDRASRGTTTNDFRELRPYSPGDPLKSVNWKATARASVTDVNLVVNQYEVEGKKAVWIFLDSAHYTGGGTTSATRFDDLAHGALVVARHFLDRGHRVGFTLYGGHETTVLHPDSGSTQERRIANLLTFAEPAAALPLVEGSDGRRQRHDGGAARLGSNGLGAAVERSRGFLARERPLAFVFTLIGRDASLEKGVTEARALSSTGRRPGVVAVLSPVPRAEAGLPGRIVALRERFQTASLARRGVHVVAWDDERRPLAALLARGVLRA